MIVDLISVDVECRAWIMESSIEGRALEGKQRKHMTQKKEGNGPEKLKATEALSPFVYDVLPLSTVLFPHVPVYANLLSSDSSVVFVRTALVNAKPTPTPTPTSAPALAYPSADRAPFEPMKEPTNSCPPITIPPTTIRSSSSCLSRFDNPSVQFPYVRRKLDVSESKSRARVEFSDVLVELVMRVAGLERSWGWREMVRAP